MHDPFGPQAEPTEHLLAEAYGFDPLLDEDLNARIDEEYDRLLVLEGWPEPGEYVDPKTGVNYPRPAFPWPSKARALITQLYSHSVQVELLARIEETMLSTVLPSIIERGGVPNTLMVKDLGTHPSGIVPRYFQQAIGEIKGDRFHISFAVPFILTPAARKIRDSGTPEEVEEIRKALIKTFKAMKSSMGGSTLKNDASIERTAESMLGLLANSVKPAEVANIMMKMAVPKKEFEEENWSDIEARLEPWR